jgi:hypothetical protein
MLIRMLHCLGEASEEFTIPFGRVAGEVADSVNFAAFGNFTQLVHEYTAGLIGYFDGALFLGALGSQGGF